jgi:hypothetical protein
MSKAKTNYVYVKDADFGWVPATLVNSEGDKATVSIPQYADEQSIVSDGGRSSKKSVEKTINLKDYHHKVLPLQNVDANGNLTEFADMVKLPYLHEVCEKRRDDSPTPSFPSFLIYVLSIYIHFDRPPFCTT